MWNPRKTSKEKSPIPPTALSRRIAMIPTYDLPKWLEQSLTSGYQWLDRYNYHRAEYPQALEEILASAEAFHALAAEIKRRDAPLP